MASKEPIVGISVAVLEALLNSVANTLSTVSTSDFCRLIVLPATKHNRGDFLSVLDGFLECQEITVPGPHTGPATYFVSHSWKTNFKVMLESLLHYAETWKLAPDTCLWIDVFCNNQHENTKSEFSWWTELFINRIKSTGRLIAVFDPLDNPTAISRVWCLYELFSAGTAQVPVTMATTATGREWLSKLLLAGNEADAVKVVSTVDCHNAVATKEDDRVQIMKAIETLAGGADAFNHTLSSLLLEAYVSVPRDLVLHRLQRTLGEPTLEALTELARAADSEQTLWLMFRWAVMLKWTSQVDVAIRVCQALVIAGKEKYGLKHNITLFALNNAGYLMNHVDRFKEAIPYLEEGLEARRELFGPEHFQTCLCMGTLARSIGGIPGKEQEAQEMFDFALKNLRAQCPPTQFHFHAVLCKYGKFQREVLKDLAGALVTFREVLASREQAFGADHPAVWRACVHVGTVLLDQGDAANLPEAQGLFARAVKGQSRVFGPQHRYATEYSRLLAAATKALETPSA